MRTFRRIALVALLVLSTGALVQAPAAAERPFSVSISGSAAPTAAARCSSLALALSATGHATHFGRLTVAGTHCTEPTLTQQAVPFWSGVATFTAADGSTIQVAYSGSQDAPVAGKASFHVDADVASGTGRFLGAAGSFGGDGVIDFTTFTLSATLAGSIAY